MRRRDGGGVGRRGAPDDAGRGAPDDAGRSAPDDAGRGAPPGTRPPVAPPRPGYRVPMDAAPPPPLAELPGYDAALERLLAAAPAPIAAERVALAAALGRTLREPIRADRDLPPFDRAAMDGYAVRAHEAAPGTTLAVTDDAPAGRAEVAAGPPGTCMRIATGAPVPAGLDAVVPHERTDRGEPVTITGSPAVQPGDAVHVRGADARSGDELVAPGTRLGPAHLGLAATVGLVEPLVARRPRVAVLTTGSEVLDPSADVAPHQIRNGNAPMLAALATAMGADVVRCEHVADDPGATEAAVTAAVAEAELLLTVGGISAGERDHVAGALAALGGEAVLRGAAIQPGKPITAVRMPAAGGGGEGREGGEGGDRLALCLPGNPVSCLACACLFAWPLLARRLGATPPPWRRVPLVAPVRPNRRREAFRPAVRTGEGVSVPPWAGSGDLAHAAPTAGLVRLPIADEELPAGTPVPFLRWPGG